MIFFKKLTAEEALTAIAALIGQRLPDKYMNAEMTLTFLDDHSVEIYINETDTTKNDSANSN